MSQQLKAVKTLISSRDLDQQLVGQIRNWPLLHFTEHAEAILADGFRFGEANPQRLDLTYEINGSAKRHPGSGYNFAFNALSWDVENDIHDFLVSSPETGRNLIGMYASSAILWLGSGLHTRHFDEFQQVIFWGEDANLGRAVHLKQLGEQAEDGEVVCDDNGNPVDCWAILDRDGVLVAGVDRYMTLTGCVVQVLHSWHEERLLSNAGSEELASLYAQELEELGLEVKIPRKPTRSSDEMIVEP